MALRCAAASAAASFECRLALGVERQRRQQRWLGVLEDVRGVDRAARRLDQAIVEQRDRLVRRDLRLAAHRDGIERLQAGAVLDAFLARQLGGKPGAGRIAGDGGAEAGDERRICL